MRKSKPLFYFSVGITAFTIIYVLFNLELLKTFGGVMFLIMILMGWFGHSSILIFLTTLAILNFGGPTGFFKYMAQPWLLVILGFIVGRVLIILKDWKAFLNQADVLKSDQYNTNYITGEEATKAIWENSIPDSKLVKHLGDVFIAEPSEDGCPRGAMAILSSQLITMRKQRIRAGEFKRNDETRRNANVPGFDKVRKLHKPVEIGEKTLFWWHRTHLLPFRYSLSEGDDIDNLIISGTSHLNHGERPAHQKDIAEYGIDSEHERKDKLISLLKQHGFHYLINPLIHNPYLPAAHPEQWDNPDPTLTTQYSLDDIEQLADFVMYQPKFAGHAFSYKVESAYSYENAMEEVIEFREIPTFLVVTMRDLTINEDIFKITLKNMY